jgi:hypothetical protein
MRFVSWPIIAVMLWAGSAVAQDRVIISTSASNQVYAPGVYTDEFPTPKPVGINIMRSFLDRADFTDPATLVEWGILYSMDGGQTYQIWKMVGTMGGDLSRFGITTSGWGHPAPPEGALILNQTKVTGGPAKFGTVLQMWEAK